MSDVSTKKSSDKSAPVPMPEPLANVFDAHTHLNAIASGGLDYRHCEPDDPHIVEIISRARTAGVGELVTVADDVQSAVFAAKTAAVHDGVYAAVGIHPMHANQLTTATKTQLEILAAQKDVVAIGETGMDRYWAEKDSSIPQLTVQEEVFRWHIDLAKRTAKALMIHNREADEDILRILASEGPPSTVIMHCFSSDADMARRCVEQGFILSFSGTVTFKNSHDLRAAAAITPLENMLVETDAPFLTPHPYRGRPNEPYCLPFTVRSLAATLNIPAETLALATQKTAHRAYGLG